MNFVSFMRGKPGIIYKIGFVPFVFLTTVKPILNPIPHGFWSIRCYTGGGAFMPAQL